MADAVTVSELTIKLGDFTAIADISFSASVGDFVSILGPNGSGKSTLLKAILGLMPPTTGKIQLFGKEPKQIPPEWIGYIPQVKTLDRSFPATSCDLVASGFLRRWPAGIQTCTHEIISEMLELVGASHLSHKPIGWLSGGELQRVYLARALVRKPRLLILDEPATGIDIVGEDDMYRILENCLAEDEITVLMVTHDWLVARHHASHALLLDRRMIAYGTPEEALTDDNIHRTFGHVGHQHAAI